MDFPELASGVSISYYIPSLEEFEEWVSEQIYAQKLSAPFNCFELLVKDEENWSNPTRRKGSDDFQLL